MNKCIGCGALLQTQNKNEIGYIIDTEKKLCERCFRIRNYGEYKTVSKQNSDFIEILKNIDKTKDLVVLVIDIFNLNQDLDIIKKHIKNDIIIVLSKKDILPKKINDEKIINYIKKYNIKAKDYIVISSKNNYNFDKLYQLINKNKKTKDVYIIGYTNAGKSTMINKLIYNYSNTFEEITTSILPSTTLNEIRIKINDELNIIDTPGILSKTSYYDILPGKELKKIIPKKEIKPISYQIKSKQYIIIDKYAILELEKINIILFMSNTLSIKRQYSIKEETLNKMTNEIIDIKNNDIVINGLGFIKCVGEGKIKIYTNRKISIYTREHLI